MWLCICGEFLFLSLLLVLLLLSLSSELDGFFAFLCHIASSKREKNKTSTYRKRRARESWRERKYTCQRYHRSSSYLIVHEVAFRVFSNIISVILILKRWGVILCSRCISSGCESLSLPPPSYWQRWITPGILPLNGWMESMHSRKQLRSSGLLCIYNGVMFSSRRRPFWNGHVYSLAAAALKTER